MQTTGKMWETKPADRGTSCRLWLIHLTAKRHRILSPRNRPSAPSSTLLRIPSRRCLLKSARPGSTISPRLPKSLKSTLSFPTLSSRPQHHPLVFALALPTPHSVISTAASPPCLCSRSPHSPLCHLDRSITPLSLLSLFPLPTLSSRPQHHPLVFALALPTPHSVISTAASRPCLCSRSPHSPLCHLDRSITPLFL
jgi:hypothetical protein